MGNFESDLLVLSGEAPFFCIALATEEKLAEANGIKRLLVVLLIYFIQFQYGSANSFSSKDLFSWYSS